MALAFSPFALFPALGLLLLAWIHFEALGVYPGLHFDEAWAMNYAWRIVNEPGFWPLTAMSPYTAPWTHYWAALWMKILGPSLLVFRASQVTLSLFGLLCLHLSLPRGSRFFFPWALFLLPGLLLNHRFAIELTGFHVLCFGLLAFGLRYRTYTLAFAAALLGTTAHILFYGVALGLLFALSLEGKEEPLPQKARLCFVAYFALMALFSCACSSWFRKKEKPERLCCRPWERRLFFSLRAINGRFGKIPGGRGEPACSRPCSY